MKKIYLSIFCLLIVLSVATYTSFAFDNKYEELLINESDVNTIYNEINQIEWTSSNLEFLHDLWEKNLVKYPDIQKDIIENDIVRLALANILLQTNRHCKLILLNKDELHEFILAKTKVENLSVKGRAIYLLGLAGYEEDIPFLSSIIENEEEGYAEEAALSMSFIHSNTAFETLSILSGKVKRESLKLFLQNIIEKNQTFPILEPNECKSRQKGVDVEKGVGDN